MSFNPEYYNEWTEEDYFEEVCPKCESDDVEYIDRDIMGGIAEEYFDCEYKCNKCGCRFHHVWIIEETPYGTYIDDEE